MILVARKFRLSARYRLVRFSAAPPALRSLVDRISTDKELYGLLVPADSERLPVKAVNWEVWRLLQAFRRPATGRSRAAGAPAELRQFLAKQVADGVLEVSAGRRFISGVAALRELSAGARRRSDLNAIQTLSRRAIELAWLSESRDPASLAMALYFNNRLPVSPSWKLRFPDWARILTSLGLCADGSRYGLHPSIVPLPQRQGQASDQYWARWDVRGGPSLRRAGNVYKLYLSPRPDGLRATLDALLERLPGSGAGRFKLGKTAAALLRPDKLVVYFGRRFDAEAMAAILAVDLASTPAQGVPFTCQIGDSGLVSIGIDPPKAVEPLLSKEGSSWRSWLAFRLARAIVNVREAGSEDPVEDALAAARAAGIDTERWLPVSDHWDFEK